MWKSLKDLEESFPGKKYSDAQKKIFLGLVERYGEGAFAATAQSFIENGSRRPLPADFKKAMSGMKPIESEQYEPKSPDCTCWHCYDTGYCFVHIEGGFEHIVACCTCNEGIWAQMRERGAIPRIETHMTRKQFLVELFKPHQDGIDEKIGWWTKNLQISRDYWATQKSAGDCSEKQQELSFEEPW